MTDRNYNQNSSLHAACDTLIARVTKRVYPREGYRSVTPLLMPGLTGLKCQALFCARKLNNPHQGGQHQTAVELRVYKRSMLMFSEVDSFEPKGFVRNK